MTGVGTSYRWIVVPDNPAAEPSRDLVGGKAWSLWRMRSLGLRVPPAFVVTTQACAAYFAGGALPEGLVEELEVGIRLLEAGLGRTFGGGERPLLVSVRSGAAISMPGMMDTVLDLGCTDAVERALAAETGDAAFAAEVHRRFCGFYGRLVLGCTEELDELPDTAAVRAAVLEDTGEHIPDDPWEQLRAAVAAVFASSRSRRAVAYRKHYGIPDDLGTAVTVQAMVFGNLDDLSGTGVLFTRDPVNGAREPYGEYLERGQGEDVVSGRVTPKPLTHLAERSPQVHAELLSAAQCLDTEGRDAQDIEFTVQRGELFLLQSRPAKRTARAAVRIAVALVDEGAIEPAEAVRRVTAEQVRTLLRPEIAPGAAEGVPPLAAGVGASPGVGTGIAVATPEEAQARAGSVPRPPLHQPRRRARHDRRRRRRHRAGRGHLARRRRQPGAGHPLCGRVRARDGGSAGGAHGDRRRHEGPGVRRRHPDIRGRGGVRRRPPPAHRVGRPGRVRAGRRGRHRRDRPRLRRGHHPARGARGTPARDPVRHQDGAGCRVRDARRRPGRARRRGRGDRRATPAAGSADGDRPPGRNDMSTAQTEPAGSDVPDSATFRAVQEIIRTFQGSGWTGMTLDVSGMHITLGKHGRPAGPVGGSSAATAAPDSAAAAAAAPVAATPTAAALGTAPVAAAAAGVAPAAPTPPATPAASPAAHPAPSMSVDTTGCVAVRSPAVGAFWVAPSPGQPPFVQVGQRVAQDEQLAIVEVMKLMNPVVATTAGEVVLVCAANAEMVEYEQVLFWIRPTDG